MISTRAISAFLVASHLIAVSACTTRSAARPGSYPTLATAVNEGCGRKGSVVLYELKGENGKDLRRTLPRSIEPGTYSIGVSCAWVFDPASNQCIDARKAPSASVPAYPLVLSSNVDYTFGCSKMMTDASGKREQVMVIGETRIKVDMTYDLRLKQAKRPIT